MENFRYNQEKNSKFKKNGKFYAKLIFVEIDFLFYFFTVDRYLPNLKTKTTVET